MSLAGTGVVAIWHDLLLEAKDDFTQWHNREHMPERVGIPGFLRGRRYIALRGAPEYFNLYEAENAQVLAGEDYLARLNAPTPWTQEAVKSFRNVSRSICDVLYSAGTGQGGVIATLRFDVEPKRAERLVADLKQRVLPELEARNGITGVHLCLADVDASRIVTREKQVRTEGTQVPRWILLVEGVGAVPTSAAADSLASLLRSGGTEGDMIVSTYQLEQTRCKTPHTAG